jgi:hypothetical protein
MSADQPGMRMSAARHRFSMWRHGLDAAIQVSLKEFSGQK